MLPFYWHTQAKVAEGRGNATTEGGKEVVPRGLEPRTLRLLAVRSNQLSYETIECKVGYTPHDRSKSLFAYQPPDKK